MQAILGFLADVIQIFQFLNYDEKFKIQGFTAFLLALVCIAWLKSWWENRKNIRVMQTEIDQMAAELRKCRVSLLKDKGLKQAEINKLFPPDDKKKKRRL